MTTRILLAALWLCAHAANAQYSFSAKIYDDESGEPLPGVTVLITELQKGKISDENGEVIIAAIPEGTYEIKISFVGYESISRDYTFPLADSLKGIVLRLKHSEEELDEVIISSTRSSRTIADSPTRVEFIAGEELAEKGNMKPGDIRMLLNESTGIQTQQTSATSYNSSIRIQGLDGKYTQLLRDGLPLYAGYSGGLSLMQIAPLDLKQVEVIKGSSSTLYGGGAIAGMVNLITKTPEDGKELSFMVNGTSALGFDLSGFYAEKYGKTGLTIFSSYNHGTPYDPADIGLTAIPKFDRFTLNPRLYFYFNERTEMNAGFNYVSENRLGGNIEFAEGTSVEDPYFERTETDRLSTQFRLSHQLDTDIQLEIKNSVNIFSRSIEIPEYKFAGDQLSSFSEVNLTAGNSELQWVGGINFWTDNFDQTEGSSENDLSYSQTTIGAFIQNIWAIHKKWTLESGFRTDYNNEYGLFALPRISLMFEPGDLLTFRLGGGLGYKTPTVFSEEAERQQFENILPIDPDNFVAEESFGVNFDINYRISISEEISLSTNTLFFYTRVNDPLQLVPRGMNFEFIQPEGFIDTKGIEFNMKWGWKDLKLFIGYTFSDVKEHYGSQTSVFPLVAKHRLNNVLMYEEHDNIWIGLEAYYFSPQQLSDGTTGEAYWIVGLMSEKRLGKHISLFLNFENFLDTRQTAFDTIFTGDIDDPEFRDIYAPVDGFVVNGGVKIKWF